MRSSAISVSLSVLLGLGVATLGTLSVSKSASALCVVNPMDGVWQNIDANTRSITKVEYRTHCNDTRVCDQYGNCSPVPNSIAAIRLFGACSPTACDWGWSPVYRHATAPWNYTIYNQGFARREVFVQYSNNQLTVFVRTKFTDNSGRQNYETWNYFKKVGN